MSIDRFSSDYFRFLLFAKSGSAFGDLSGSIDAYTYNARSELTSARRTKNGQPIPGFSEDFDYDPIGNRRSSATYNEKGEAQTSTYQANNLNQYTSRTTPGYAAVRGEADPSATVTVNENPTFRLGSYYFGSDLFDNTAAGGFANLETYATLVQTAANGDESEDLVSAATNQVYLAQSPETFAYDDDGNQTLITTKTGLWRVTYNGENRPILWKNLAVESDNQTITNQTILTMSYDHMGRRREKNDQHFFYDRYLQVADNAGNAYTWDCTEPVATRPIAWHCANASNYYTHDGNKNVSEVVAADCSLAAHYGYTPFGVVATQCGPSAATNPWRFSSEYADIDTATIYYNYRHYESVTGWWMSRDPSAEYGGINLYCFCFNDCIIGCDELGRSPWSVIVKQGLKVSAKKALIEYIEKHIQKELIGSLKDKAFTRFAKELGSEAFDILNLLDASWWEILVECVPVAGDIYGTGKFAIALRNIDKRLSVIEKKAEYLKNLKKGNLKKPDAGFLKRNGYRDIHNLKNDMLKGSKNREPVSHYDVCIDKNGVLILMKKNGEIVEISFP